MDNTTFNKYKNYEFMKPVKLIGFILILLGWNFASAQTPSFYNSNGGTSSNTFPLASTTNTVQWLYTPNVFNSAGSTGIPSGSGTITKVYFRIGSTGSTSTYTNFTIKLGQTSDTLFPTGDTFFTNLTLVRFDSVYTIPAGAQGDWFGIDLQTPFVYDSSKTLIVEIKFYNTTQSAFGTLGNSNTTQKLISADTAALAQTGFGSTTWQDFGFDYLITTGKVNLNTAKEILLFPNPGKEFISIYNLPLTNKRFINIYDVYGKLILSKSCDSLNNSETIDIRGFENGLYITTIQSDNLTLTKKFIKN